MPYTVKNVDDLTGALDRFEAAAVALEPAKRESTTRFFTSIKTNLATARGELGSDNVKAQVKAQAGISENLGIVNEQIGKGKALLGEIVIPKGARADVHRKATAYNAALKDYQDIAKKLTDAQSKELDAELEQSFSDAPAAGNADDIYKELDGLLQKKPASPVAPAVPPRAAASPASGSARPAASSAAASVPSGQRAGSAFVTSNADSRRGAQGVQRFPKDVLDQFNKTIPVNPLEGGGARGKAPAAPAAAAPASSSASSVADPAQEASNTSAASAAGDPLVDAFEQLRTQALALVKLMEDKVKELDNPNHKDFAAYQQAVKSNKGNPIFRVIGPTVAYNFDKVKKVITQAGATEADRQDACQALNTYLIDLNKQIDVALPILGMGQNVKTSSNCENYRKSLEDFHGAAKGIGVDLDAKKEAVVVQAKEVPKKGGGVFRHLTGFFGKPDFVHHEDKAKSQGGSSSGTNLNDGQHHLPGPAGPGHRGNNDEGETS